MGRKWFEVVDELVERLFGVGDVGVSHPVVPCFCIGGSSSSTHLVQGGHDLGSVGGIQGGVQGKVGLHGLDPSSGVVFLPGKVRGEGGL